VTFKGNLASPRFSAEGALSSVRAFGLFLPRINFEGVKGDKHRVDFSNIRATAGRGSINANGHIELSGDMKSYLSVAGTSVDIRALLTPLEMETRRQVTGALDFNFSGEGPLGSFKGVGHGRIPALSVFGVKATDVKADFSVSDGYAVIEDSSAKLYGGDIMAQVVKDFNSTDWGGRVEIKSADVARAFKDFMPESEGSISGAADFSLRFVGDSRKTNMQDSNGALDVYNGEIAGFEGAKALSEKIGGKPLRFATAHFAFTIDGKTLNIIPGSRVSAPKGDPAYKYVMLDGSVNTDSEISLNCDGDVNLMALNALVSGLQGVLSVAADNDGDFGDSDELLRNFLGSAISGYTKKEFRGVSLKVKGKPGNLVFSDISISSPVKMDTLPEALKDKGEGKDDTGLKITLEFPVGPGGDGNSPGSVENQLGGQLLDQIIKGLIFESD
jgi:hypothetical protein